MQGVLYHLTNYKTRQLWLIEYRKLDNEIDEANKFFIKNRSCKCRLECGYAICKHWKTERHRVFGKRINEVWQLNLNSTFEILKALTG